MRYLLLFILALLSASQGLPQSFDDKIDTVISKYQLGGLVKFRLQNTLIDPLKMYATGSDSLMLIAIENELTDDAINTKLRGSVTSIFTELEIDELYQFFSSSAFHKLLTLHSYEAYFFRPFQEIEERISAISTRLGTPSNTYQNYVFSPIEVDRENGLYTVVGEIPANNNDYHNIALSEQASLTFDLILSAEKDYDYAGRSIISIRLSERGARLFHKLTEENIGRPIAIVVGKKIVSLPIVNEAIPFGNLSISGDFSDEELDAMLAHLNRKR